MAAFTPQFELEQSPDGKTIIINDLSNYPDSDEVYVQTDFQRSATIRNAVGDVIDIIAIDGLSKSFTIESNLWANVLFTWTGLGAIEGTDFQETLNYPLDRITKNMFMRELSQYGCSGCGSKQSQEAMINADLFHTGMEYAAPAGESIRWQEYSNTAFKFLDSIR